MKIIKKIGFVALGFLVGCTAKDKEGEANGSFQVNELIVCALTEGVLTDIYVEEGQKVKAGDCLASVDSTQWVLQKKQVQTTLDAALLKTDLIPDKYNRLNDSILFWDRIIAFVYDKSQKDSLLQRRQQLENDLIEYKKTLSKPVRLLLSQTDALYLQLRQINDVIYKCRICSPIDGHILNTYAKKYEPAMTGKPILRIADLSQMTLNAYVSQEQLSSLKLGNKCRITIDKLEGEVHEMEGILTWISPESEFTPKNVRTSDERINLVYAVKVVVKNDGSIKEGMQGEVWFSPVK